MIANIVLLPTTHSQDLAPTMPRNCCRKAQDGLRSDRIEGSRTEIRKDRDLKWWSLLAKKEKKKKKGQKVEGTLVRRYSYNG